MHPNPEGVVHHVVGVGQVTADTVVGPNHIGLTCQIAGEQQTGAGPVLVQVSQQVQPRDRSVFFQGDRKAKPGRIRVFGGLGQVDNLFAVFQASFQKYSVSLNFNPRITFE